MNDCEDCSSHSAEATTDTLVLTCGGERMLDVDYDATFPVVEIFDSMQGEGANTGRRCNFIRLGGCNLKCEWCDTDFSQHKNMSVREIIAQLNSEIDSVIITGGEPTIHKQLPELLKALQSNNYWVAIETNGINDLSEYCELLDYISVSPKAHYATLYGETSLKFADEVRIVADGDCEEFCRKMRSEITAKHYFISPCDKPADGTTNMDIIGAITLLGKLNENLYSNPWLLSIQTHKLAGIR